VASVISRPKPSPFARPKTMPKVKLQTHSITKAGGKVKLRPAPKGTPCIPIKGQ
jgi:hypothetical protein